MPQAHEWTILKLLQWTTSYFKSRNIDSPRMTAEILLAHCLKTERINLYLDHDQPLSKSELTEFKALIKRRANREPVAHVVGSKEFWSMDFDITKDVLIPRPDTECLVETALSVLKPSGSLGRIFEPGTGSGAISVALASERPEDLFFASDCSLPCVHVAKKNAEKNGLADRIHFFCGSWFGALNTPSCAFDMILSNPPYIPTHAIASLEPEIHRYEPTIALDGGHDGLAAIRFIIGSAHLLLKDKGWLLLEIGHDQKNRIDEMIQDTNHYMDPEFTKDYAGHHRVVRMMKKL